MTTLLTLLPQLTLGALALIDLDVDGYLRSDSFLTLIANAISGILIAIFSIFTGGA